MPLQMYEIARIHHRYLSTLCFNKAFDTLSYLGTQTLLVLYYIHVFHFSEQAAYLIYGVYATLAFSAPILAGIMVDKWLEPRNALIFGSILNVVGNLLMVSFDVNLFSLGLTCSVIGAGIYKGSATSLLGSLYNDKKSAERGFTWLYLTTNIGGALGPLSYGFAVARWGWNAGFMLSAIGLTLGLLWFLALKPQRILTEAKPRRQVALAYGLILSCCAGLSLLFRYPALINYFVIVLFSLSVVYLYRAITRFHGADRRHLQGLAVLSFFGMFYFAAGMQIGSLITLYIQHKIDSGVIDTQLPASTFVTLYPLFVLLAAPMFRALWQQLEQRGWQVTLPHKMALGMGLASLGILVFAFGTSSSYVLLYISVGIFFLSAGEMALTPAMYTAIGYSSPKGMKSTMLGCWYLAVAFGSYLSSILARSADQLSRLFNNQNALYLDNFLVVFAFSACATLVMVLLSNKIKHLIE